MTPEQYIYFGAYFTALHKNKIFRECLRKSFIIFVEKSYFG